MSNRPAAIISMFVMFCAFSVAGAAGLDARGPIIGQNVVFEETGGRVAVEAEHFYKQTLNKVRSWYIFTPAHQPRITPDGDPAHLAGASGGAYVEILPDTRRTHADKLITGKNFSNEPGKMAILHYKVHFNTPGKYYVWARIFSTNGEDNGMHVGIDGAWPATGQRMQWIGKKKWVWGSKQRTAKKHTGEPYKLFLNVDKPGEHTIMFAMREDGTEFDKWMMIKEKKSAVNGPGPAPRVKKGKAPKPFPAVKISDKPKPKPAAGQPKRRAGKLPAGSVVVNPDQFAIGGSNYYLDKGKWLAIDPAQHKSARAQAKLSIAAGDYHVTLYAVGESDGKSSFELLVAGKPLGTFVCPLAGGMYAEGPKFTKTWPKVAVGKNATVEVRSQIASIDGKEFSRARVARVTFTPSSAKAAGMLLFPAASAKSGKPKSKSKPKPVPTVPLVMPRKPDGDGAITVGGELKQWHKVTLTQNGPFAYELDNAPNPFTDYRMTVTFRHESGSPKYVVPGYFAADGNSANSSAASGVKWRAHLSPDKKGKWSYTVSFVKGKQAAVSKIAGAPVAGCDQKSGTFTVKPTDKTGRDLRSKGRLQYVGKHHLRFAGSGEYFLKCGADAPENFLAYKDFDGSFKSDGHKDNLIKTWAPHVRDWRKGDPTWGKGKGKGIIGAVNYLASEGMNAFSFLPMNIAGDDRNVFPYTSYNDREHIDCSRMDQWAIVFEHGTNMGMYLHFKTMETENELLLDKGDLGPQRKLYYRELIARFAHNLALNWNLGEEINNASHAQKVAWANYFAAHDPYRHNIVIHNMGEPHYDLMGDASALTGFSLQTNRPDFSQVHSRTLDYINRSVKAGKPWVVACDEPGDATHSLRPDNDAGTSHTDARKHALWGHILAGGAGLEFYFGYKHAHSDLTCQDHRSRDKFWDYCRYALEFFSDNKIPFWEMTNADALAGPAQKNKRIYCLAKTGEIYLVYLTNGGQAKLDLSKTKGSFTLQWFNPRKGGKLQTGSVKQVTGGGPADIGKPPTDQDKDWLTVIRRK
jgi:hypothetical protein